MADILEFRVTEKRSRKAQGRRRRGAEIVIFPGVRYERWDAAPSTAAVAGGGGSATGVVRDRLTLVD